MKTAAVAVLLIGAMFSANANTDPVDASTLNILYTSLNSPQQLSNWKASGGDPCTESWTGVTCSGSRVTEIVIPGLGLTGNMGYQLDQLTSVTTFDISSNNLGNQIPYQLPPNVQRLNLASCNFSGGLPYSISLMSSLQNLNVSHNQIQGQVNLQFNTLTALSTLDFSFNALTDNLPQSFESLTGMRNLYLQNNQFTGTIDVLSNLPLENLNVAHNSFTGWIPDQLKHINSLETDGNQFNSGPSPPSPPGTPTPGRGTHPSAGHSTGSSSVHSSGSKSGVGAGALAGIVVGVVVIAAILAFILLRRRSRKHSSDIEKHTSEPFAPVASSQEAQDFKAIQTSSAAFDKAYETPAAMVNLKPPPAERSKSFDEEDGLPEPAAPPPRKVDAALIKAKVFSVADLQVATDSFSVDNLLGEGSLGRVYCAQTDDGKVLAVKKVNSSALASSGSFLEIVLECSRLHHPNITELVGYCCEHGQHLLVYPLEKNGSLHDLLHLSDEYSKPLTWNSRVKIALGSARALEYLHEVCSPSVIHKNLKSANILLDAELNARLSDCGLGSLVSERDQANGFTAPEVAMSGQYTMKSDVYSFGVVMLELLTGRKPFDSSRPRSEQSLVRWAAPQLHDIDALTGMVDPALKGMYPAKSLSGFADVVALCVQPEPEFRPAMSEVVESLVRLVQRATMSKRTLGNEGSYRNGAASADNE